jgi:hypothetical protein
MEKIPIFWFGQAFLKKKEARIPLIPEWEELLASFRPLDVKPTDRVFNPMRNPKEISEGYKYPLY